MRTAKFPGRCGLCGDDFDKGSRIGSVEGEWCCETCVVQDQEMQAERPDPRPTINGEDYERWDGT